MVELLVLRVGGLKEDRRWFGSYKSMVYLRGKCLCLLEYSLLEWFFVCVR